MNISRLALALGLCSVLAEYPAQAASFACGKVTIATKSSPLGTKLGPDQLTSLAINSLDPKQLVITLNNCGTDPNGQALGAVSTDGGLSFDEFEWGLVTTSGQTFANGRDFQVAFLNGTFYYTGNLFTPGSSGSSATVFGTFTSLTPPMPTMPVIVTSGSGFRSPQILPLTASTIDIADVENGYVILRTSSDGGTTWKQGATVFGYMIGNGTFNFIKAGSDLAFVVDTGDQISGTFSAKGGAFNEAMLWDYTPVTTFPLGPFSQDNGAMAAYNAVSKGIDIAFSDQLGAEGEVRLFTWFPDLGTATTPFLLNDVFTGLRQISGFGIDKQGADYVEFYDTRNATGTPPTGYQQFVVWSKNGVTGKNAPLTASVLFPSLTYVPYRFQSGLAPAGDIGFPEDYSGNAGFTYVQVFERQADLAISGSAPATVPDRTPFTVNLTLSCSAPVAAVLDFGAVKDTTFQSLVADSIFTCKTPSVGASGAISCASNKPCSGDVTVSITEETTLPAGTPFFPRATATSLNSCDADTGNNTKTFVITVGD